MGDFFNVDNKFFQGLGKIIDVICLSAFWLFFMYPDRDSRGGNHSIVLYGE